MPCFLSRTRSPALFAAQKAKEGKLRGHGGWLGTSRCVVAHCSVAVVCPRFLFLRECAHPANLGLPFGALSVRAVAHRKNAAAFHRDTQCIHRRMTIRVACSPASHPRQGCPYRESSVRKAPRNIAKTCQP